MKRKTFVLFSLVMVVTLTVGTGCLLASSSEFPDASKDRKVTLSWGGTAAAEDLTSLGMQRVAKLVEERSGGSLKINVFPASQLGDAMTQMEMVINGNIDMFIEGSNYMADWGVPERYVAGLYFQCPSKDAFLRLLRSDFYKSWEDKFLKETGVRTLANNWMRPPVEIASNIPLYTLEDFQNLKLRSIPSKYTLDALQTLGTKPTPVAYQEVYLALQQGVIEATIATLDAVYKMNFYQVTKYLCLVDLGYVNFAVWMNDKKFQSLSPAQQEILVRTCNEVGDWYMKSVDEELDGYVEKMVEHGVEVIRYSAEERARFAAAVRQLVDKYVNEGIWPKGLFEEFLAVVSEL